MTSSWKSENQQEKQTEFASGDADGGAEAFDGVDVGAFELVEELARVCGEGFDVAALALGVDGVKG